MNKTFSFYTYTEEGHLHEKLLAHYTRHKRGYFILGPSGCGKSYFVNHLSNKHDWIDGDMIWTATHAQPRTAWWEAGDSAPSLRLIDAMSDVITYQAVQQGYRIIGASNLWLRPDAVVLPPLEKHTEYLTMRSTGENYDGGLTIDQLSNVKEHRERIRLNAQNPQLTYRTIDTKNIEPVPIFESVEEAARFLESQP